MASEQSDKLIKIIVKTAQVKETFEINEKADVKELKILVSEKFKSDVNHLCLIFAGKILKDNETLEQHKITDGLTIHLVIKKKSEDISANASSTNTARTSGNNSTTNSSSGSSNSNNSSNFNGLPSFFNNPNFEQNISQLFDNVHIQSFLSNPENIKAMLTMSPQMQQLLENHPELNHFLNNNEFIRQTSEMIRNPAAFQELMRQQDRALSNLESIPGGYNALRRIYSDLQEPMFNAVQEHENPFAIFANQNSNNSSTNNTTNQSGTENRDPLPNPWNRNANDNNSASSCPATGCPNTNSNSLFDPSRMLGFLNQIKGNPGSMSQILNSPQMQQMTELLTRNFDSIQQILGNNNNSLNQTSMPEAEQNSGNNEAVNALLQITRGIQRLQKVSPNLLSSLARSGASETSQGLSTSTENTNNTTNTSTPSSNTSQSNSTSNANINSISQLLSQMLTSHVANSANTANVTTNSSGNENGLNLESSQPPEERFRNQLEQLNSMGFTDRQQNINALVESFGDVNGAVEKLLQSRSYFN